MFKKIFLSIIATLGISLVGCSALDRMMTSAPIDYYNQTSTSQPLEQKYTKMGDLSVASQVIARAENNVKEYKIWYPEALMQSTHSYPVVVFANGTGVPYYKYEAVFAHLASWGFVVIGNDDSSSWSGSSSASSLALLAELNQDKNSVFYNKLNIKNAGITGHSQGGVGAINAATRFPNSANFSAIYTASTPKYPLAAALKWHYDVSKVNVPYFMTTGSGSIDAGNAKEKDSGIAPIASLEENFAKVPNAHLKVMARRTDVDHGEMLYVPDGYMTAWFRYTLLNDTHAAKAFIGDNAEILKNSNWQDVKKNK